jgi:hypothetical protein
MKKQNESYNNATAYYYPNVPDPPLPLSLPLVNYTGTYFHPAYHNLTITISPSPSQSSTPGKLYVLRSNASWKVASVLEQISGEYFMLYLDSTQAPGLLFKQAVPAEFSIGADGVVGKFGIAAEPEMGKEGKVWFERIA